MDIKNIRLAVQTEILAYYKRNGHWPSDNFIEMVTERTIHASELAGKFLKGAEQSEGRCGNMRGSKPKSNRKH